MKTKITFICSLGLVVLLSWPKTTFSQTWLCRNYVIRQPAPSGTLTSNTELDYVYENASGIPASLISIYTYNTVQFNGLAEYNGKLYAWKQYGANTGVGGEAIVQLNTDGTLTYTTINTGYNASINAADIDLTTGIYYGIGSNQSASSNTFLIVRINVVPTTPTNSGLSNLTVTLPTGTNFGAMGDISIIGDTTYFTLNNVGLFKYKTPATGTNAVTAILVGTNNRTIGSTFYLLNDPYNLYGYGTAAGGSTQDRLLRINKFDGTITEITAAGGTGVSQSDGASCNSGVITNPVLPSISGNVFNDANGLTDGTVNGTGIGILSTVQLYANLVDNTGKVVATVPINADGTYVFGNISSAGTYTIQITKNQGTVGSTAPAITLPTGWANTGNVIANGTPSNTTPGISAPITVLLGSGTTSNATFVNNVNFGVTQAALGITGFLLTGNTTSNCNINLSWKTLTEINTKYFEIQYSSDGINYASLGVILAKGNSNIQQNYSFINANAKYSYNYFRIKEVDSDGQFTYSNTIHVTTNCNGNVFITTFPNPVKNDVTIVGAEFGSQIVLLDISGKVIKNQIANGSNADKMELDQLANGIYLIKILHNKVITTVKFIKE